MFLLRAEYRVENNKPAVYLFQREEDGNRVVTVDNTLTPYFFIPEGEENILQGIRVDKGIYEAIDGTKIRKIYTTLPEDVPKLRDKYSRTWEADILFPTRYTIDKVDTIEPTIPKKIFLDIEVDNTGKMPNISLAQEPIICITAYDNLTDIYSTFVYRHDLSPGNATRIFDNKLHENHYFKSEEDLLKSFIGFINTEEPDVLSGWNCSRFDLPYLLNRMAVLCMDSNKLSPMNSAYIREGKDVVIKGVAIIDLYDAYRKFTQGLEENYKLDFIARKVIGEGKTDSESNVRLLWKINLDRLIGYNLTDCYLCVKINEKLKLLEFLDELRRISFCQLEDTFSASRTSDCYILRLFHGKKVFPTKTHHKKVAYEGAFIANWAEGIYDNVVIFDLRSLYPSIIVSANLSPETIMEGEELKLSSDLIVMIDSSPPSSNIITINNLKIKQQPKGFLPEVIENLFKERTRYKELMEQEPIDSDDWNIYYQRQYALKTLLNALYGQTAYVGSRIYDPRIAETTTWMGRKIINWSKDFIEGIGYKVLYADTDALAWSIGDKVDIKEIEYILTLLNNSYDDFAKQVGLDHHIFEMEFEKVYRKAFFGKDIKKRYSGAVCYQSGKEVDRLETVGFEIRRSDASQFSRNLQEKVFDMLLRQDRTKEEVLRYIGDEIDRIRKGNFKFTEIGIPKGISKELSDYGKIDKDGQVKGIPANIRGTKYAQEVLGHELSSKPKMVYISKIPNNYPITNVLCFDEDGQVPPGTEIDVEKMLEKLVKDKTQSIFEALGWRLSELVPWWKGKPSKKEGEQLGLFVENP